MIIKIKINKTTQECTTDDASVVVNSFIETNDEIEVELSRPDPEQPMNSIPWQQ